MATLVPSIYPALDAIRSIGDNLGLRLWTVLLTVRTWSGGQPGFGTKTDTTFQLLNTDSLGNTHPVRVKQVSRNDIIASGGLYSTQSLRCGPMTPNYVANGISGGVTTANLDPPTTTPGTEIFWHVTGPGIPSGGAWYGKVGEEAKAMSYYVIIDRNALKP